jgi:hypothetical protein
MIMNSKHFSALALAAWLLLAGPSTAAPAATAPVLSPTARPTAWDVHFIPYRVAGYGHATFGMTLAEVKALIAHDFPEGLAGLKDAVDVVSGMRTLTIVVPKLAPGPGAATMTYVFGNASQRLAAVNVYWIAEGQATAAQRADLVGAASTVVSALAGWKWGASWLGRVIGANELVVFSGRDIDGGGVEVRLDGVDLDIQPLPATASAPLPPLVHRPTAPGPARLRLSFVSDTRHPDVYRIPAGAF